MKGVENVDTATYVTMLILNFVATGLIFVAIIKWKKEEIKPLKHIVPTAIFGLFDIVGLAMGAFYVPIFLPSIAIIVLGVNLRKQQWPSEPKFAAYYKLYIFLLAFCFLVFTAFGSPGYDRLNSRSILKKSSRLARNRLRDWLRSFMHFTSIPVGICLR